jgi:hypothetical protein
MHNECDVSMGPCEIDRDKSEPLHRQHRLRETACCAAAAVAVLSNSFSLVVARKNLPADDLKGLIDWLKANPDKATQGHVGIGSVGHIGGLLLQNMTGTRFQQVPYRGSAPVMQALLGGQIDFGIESKDARDVGHGNSHCRRGGAAWTSYLGLVCTLPRVRQKTLFPS